MLNIHINFKIRDQCKLLHYLCEFPQVCARCVTYVKQHSSTYTGFATSVVLLHVLIAIGEQLMPAVITKTNTCLRTLSIKSLWSGFNAVLTTNHTPLPICVQHRLFLWTVRLTTNIKSNDIIF